MCPQYKYEAMGSTFQNLQHFDIADNADEYHQISEAAACKDEEADPEEWSARNWWHRWCAPLFAAVLSCAVVCWCSGVLVCCRVLVFWCHRYSNSTPAAPLLPFIFNLWHAVQLFELITSAAASVLRHHQWNIWLAFQLVALPTATSLLTSEKSTWHPMVHSRPVRVQRHQQSRNLKVCEYQQME